MRLNESGIGSLEWCLGTVLCAARAWGIVRQEGLAEPSPDRRSSRDYAVQFIAAGSPGEMVVIFFFKSVFITFKCQLRPVSL